MLSVRDASDIVMVPNSQLPPAPVENQGFGFGDLVELRPDEVALDADFRARRAVLQRGL
jgi:hypothetical protein